MDAGEQRLDDGCRESAVGGAVVGAVEMAAGVADEDFLLTVAGADLEDDQFRAEDVDAAEVFGAETFGGVEDG
jgi:hypothetical protein